MEEKEWTFLNNSIYGIYLSSASNQINTIEITHSPTNSLCWFKLSRIVCLRFFCGLHSVMSLQLICSILVWVGLANCLGFVFLGREKIIQSIKFLKCGVKFSKICLRIVKFKNIFLKWWKNIFSRNCHFLVILQSENGYKQIRLRG